MTVGSPFTSQRMVFLRGHRGSVRDIQWNCEGKKLATAAADKLIRVWNPERRIDPHYTTELRGHTDAISGLTWDPADPDRLASVGYDKLLCIWDTKRGNCMEKLTLNDPLLHAAWSPDGQTIALCDKKDNLIFVDVSETKVVETIVLTDKYQVHAMCWNPQSDLLFLATGQGQVLVYSFPKAKLVYTIHAHVSACYCIQLDPTGQYLAVGSSDSLVSLWELTDFTCVKTLDKGDNAVQALSFSHDGKHLAVAPEGGNISVFSVRTGETVQTIAYKSTVMVLAWNPAKPFLAFTADEKEAMGAHSGYARIYGIP